MSRRRGGSENAVPRPDGSAEADSGRGGFGGRAVAAVLVALLLFVAGEGLVEHHGHFEFEELFALHALIGFGAAVGIAVLATVLEAALGREEGYYDR